MVAEASTIGRHAGANNASGSGFSSRSAFILAAAGSAVGLGNIWKFPYIAGENGGGAFVLIYLGAILVIGVPALIAEILVGRLGGRPPVSAIATLALASGRSRHWRLIGWLGLVAGFAILSFYSVVAGWSLNYLWQTVSGQLFAALGPDPAATFGTRFEALLADPMALIVAHSIIMGITVAVVSRGIRRGVERATSVMMPVLILLLVALVGYAAAVSGSVGQAARFLLAPDFGALTVGGIVTAIGHACFTLSVGMTAMMAYGSHLHGSSSIGGTACVIAGVDTLIALLAGFAIFPIVFANGLEPGAGPGLIFVTLPISFLHMPGGIAVAAAFFLLLAVAALTSTLSLLEPVVQQAGRRYGWSRQRCAVVAGGLIWLLGLATVFSFNEWSDVSLFGFTPYELLDKVTADWLLPIGVLATALFVGWNLPRAVTVQEFGGDRASYRAWRWALRYGTPAGILIAAIYALAT